ncbi:MAG: hypothetical protein RLZZ182_678 [Pseudomonadota bacterium]|jgi:hypothetical protein
MAHHHFEGAPAPGLAAPELATPAAEAGGAMGAVGAAPAGLSEPQKDEGPTGASGRAFREQSKDDGPHSADTPAQRKAAATLQARAALLGMVLEPAGGSAWTLTGSPRRGTVPSLQAAAAVVYGCELARADLAAMLGRRSIRGEVRA